MTPEARIPLVDQLRGIAAATVAWFHLTNGYEGWVAETGTWGWLGVEAFFVISGFIIPYSLSRTPDRYRTGDLPAFLVRRIVRLEPPYLASIALVIALNVAAASNPLFQGAPPNFDPLQVLAHLFYLVPLTTFDWIQPVYWTLAYEFAFYLTIGLLFPLMGASHQQWTARVTAAVVIGLVASGMVSHLLALFVMGFAVHLRLAIRGPLAWTLGLTFAASIAMMARGAIAEATVGAGTAVVILSHRSIPPLPRWLGSSLTSLGIVSYSLYLVHVPIGGKVVNLGGRFVEGNVGELILSLCAFGVSVGAALLLYRFVEMPATAAARRMSKRTRQVGDRPQEGNA